MAKPSAGAQPTPLLSRAIELHQQGRLSQAEAIYRQILERDSANFDALHLCGVIEAQNRRYGAANKLIAKALRHGSDSAAAFAAHTNLGNVRAALGQSDAALESYERALRLRPDYAPAHTGRAELLQRLQRLEEAAEAYAGAIRVGIGGADLHRRHGDLLARLGRGPQALVSYDLAIASGSQSADLYSNRGAVLIGLRRWEEALGSCQRAIALDAGNAVAHANRGNALERLGRGAEALASYDQAIALAPNYAGLHSNRAAALNALQRWPEALESCQRALALDPNLADAHCNGGGALHGMGRSQEALASFDRAIALRANYPEAHLSRGSALWDLKQFDAALECYDRALECRSDYPEARLARAMLRLQRSDWPGGWEEYEWRWANIKGCPRRNFAVPQWRGLQKLSGKRILLHAEQGLGDTIQFCRYAPAVAQLGAEVILEVQPSLCKLLAGLPGVSRLIAGGEPLPAFDLHVPLLSLPLAFGTELTSIPCPQPYLRAEPAAVARWRERLRAYDGPRIGIVWSGNAKQPTEHHRRIPLADLLRSLPTGFTYVGVQKEVRAEDEPALHSSDRILYLGGELDDFADTAALCQCLDLLVSVDTSVAHLAGALGRPTWVLLSHLPDWRWLLDRTDSPWYESVSLYRQSRPGDWSGVLEHLGNDLLRRFRSEA